MIRETLSAESAHLMLVVFADGQTSDGSPRNVSSLCVPL